MAVQLCGSNAQEEIEDSFDIHPAEVWHAVEAQDRITVEAMREQLKGAKGMLKDPSARGAFNGIMSQIAIVAGVGCEPGMVAGVPGVWIRPADADPSVCLMHLHGGAYILGSAESYQGFASQFSSRSLAATFIPNYRLAPEHPFPAAFDDAVSVYRALATSYRRIGVIGDSAGGGLALALLNALHASEDDTVPAAAVVISPWADLALTGASMQERAEADPLVSREMLEACSALYLSGADPQDKRASPLTGPIKPRTPLQIHVGHNEVLLDDARRYGQRVVAAGGDIEVHVWEAMAHVFPSAAGVLQAADAALAMTGRFLQDHLQVASSPLRAAR